MKKLVIAFGMFLLLAFAIQLHAQIPRTLSYQGILTDNAGNHRPEKNYQFTFSLYDTLTGGTPIWSEQKTLPVNKGGLFSTILGDQKPLGAAVKFDKQYWLGIQVENEAELSPRISLTSVGYSLSAVRADTANYSFMAESTSDAWITKDDTIYTLKGNIGIGIKDPKFKFTVGDINHTCGINPHLNGIDLYSTGDFAPHFQTTYYWYTGKPGSGVEKMRLESDGSLFIRGWVISLSGADFCLGTNDGRYIGNKHGQRALVHDVNDVLVVNYAGDFEGGTRIDGRLKTNILEILGGSDLAEPFEISHADSLPVGSLVVIDPEQPGKLKQATEPYDKRVAGVISGAGGINPGLTLTQDGKLTGSQHVALTGKVYALATAANGAIEPGDLLTTSNVPGHAMKATDHERAFGTVIGKAMSTQKDGEGLILVLVNLQ